MKNKNFALWLKKNLFSTPTNSVVSILLLTLLTKLSFHFFQWLFVDAVWFGNANDCREASGACVSFIISKFKFLLFGLYPEEELYRPILSIFLLLGLFIYTKEPKRWNSFSLRLWIIYFITAFILIKGGLFGFKLVETHLWGGLPLTLILAIVGFVAAYPLGILLALGRKSKMTIIKTFTTVYIELIRGVPLISLLFMSSVMLPLFLPENFTINKLVRAQIAIIMFVAAYLAEVVRGGLQSIPKGQYEAANALGLSAFQANRFIILPQALKVIIPPTVNTIIGMFKDTSLVIIIALFDLMYTTKASLSDTEWLGFSLEAYIFAALIYFMFCYCLSRYSRRLEKEIGIQSKG